MRLFVGNLAYQTTSDELRNLFATAGEVTSSTIVTDRDTGRPRGFAFVEMVDREAGERAIRLLNNKALNGRQLTVNEAKPREPRGGGDQGGGGARGGRNQWRGNRH